MKFSSGQVQLCNKVSKEQLLAVQHSRKTAVMTLDLGKDASAARLKVRRECRGPSITLTASTALQQSPPSDGSGCCRSICVNRGQAKADIRMCAES